VTQLGGYLSLRLAVSTVRYPIPERTFGHVSTRYGIPVIPCEGRDPSDARQQDFAK
jgi:hypothetical protein